MITITLPVLDGIRDNRVAIGFGDTALTLEDSFKKAEQHFLKPFSRTTTRQRFIDLTFTWRYETRYTSAAHEIIMHPAYQRIIGMGEKVLPLILRELSRSPYHWYWALESITGVNPVKKNHRGNLTAMTHDWLDWASKNGYEV